MLYSKTLLFIHPKYTSLHLLIPNSQSFPPPLILYFMSIESHNVYSFVSGFFHLTSCLCDQCILLFWTLFILIAAEISLSEHIIIDLFILQLIGVWIIWIAVSIPMHIFWWLYMSISIGYTPWTGITELYKVDKFSIKRYFQIFFQSDGSNLHFYQRF